MVYEPQEWFQPHDRHRLFHCLTPRPPLGELKIIKIVGRLALKAVECEARIP